MRTNAAAAAEARSILAEAGSLLRLTLARMDERPVLSPLARVMVRRGRELIDRLDALVAEIDAFKGEPADGDLRRWRSAVLDVHAVIEELTPTR